MSSLHLPLTGSCQCGAIAYKVSEPPLTLYCCHCTECQAQSTSAFGMSLRISADSLSFDAEPSVYIRDEGKSTQVECLFCPDCGTRLAHRRGSGSANASVKFSSLDDLQDMEPVGHIWTRSKQAWVILDEESLVYETQPSDGYAALIERFSLQHT